LVELLNWGNLSAVYFASPSAWKRFLSVYNKTEKMPFVFYAIGDTTKKSINDSGYQAVLVRR